MKNSELPIWLLALLGLSDYTPRGMAVRFGKNKLAMVQRPKFADGQGPTTDTPEAPSLAPQAATAGAPDDPKELPLTPDHRAA